MPVGDVSGQDGFYLSAVQVYTNLAGEFSLVDKFSVIVIPTNRKKSVSPQRHLCRQVGRGCLYLFLLTLSSRLFSVHHSARLLISSRYERSPFIMCPMMLVSSVGFTIEFSWCQGEQSWVYRVNRRWLSTQPWGLLTTKSRGDVTADPNCLGSVRQSNIQL